MVVKKVVEEKPVPYHIMVRYITGKGDFPEQNMFTAATVDEHVKTWINLGYEVDTCASVGQRLDDLAGAAEGVLYLFKYVG